MKPFYIGIDLHGTLLNRKEEFPEKCIGNISKLLKDMSDFLYPVTCTGNDISFVQKKLPSSIFSQMKGHVLETGCTFGTVSENSNGTISVTEKILVSDEIVQKRNNLEKLIKDHSFKEITRVGRRLATVSLFTDFPEKFSRKITSFIDKYKYLDEFSVTWSSVAVDIVPKSFDKLKGLKIAAKNNDIIGVADSVNDIPLLKGADYSFSPSNIAIVAENTLRKSGMKIVQIDDSLISLEKATLYKANYEDAKGVEEILLLLKKLMPRYTNNQ